LGKKEAQGLREPHEYMDKVGAFIQSTDFKQKNGDPFGYIIAPARLEIEAGYNILKQSVMISIRDPEDSIIVSNAKVRDSVRLAQSSLQFVPEFSEKVFSPGHPVFFFHALG